MMFTVGEKYRDMLACEHSLFVSPWLTSYIQRKQRQFNAFFDKKKFHWDRSLSDMVLLPGQEWVTNVHTIYAPMIWSDSHWIGLAKNLPMRLVEILDPLPTLHSDTEVKQLLQPLLQMLPYAINKLATPTLSQFSGDHPFTYTRIPGLYQSTRDGDSGPVSVKFMEMHALGDPEPHMSGITDYMVDDSRKQYAMSIYKCAIPDHTDTQGTSYS